MSIIIAFYLPQYHPIPENDEWYGKGFTEWTNVAKAKPLFFGHYQPHLPGELGFYDLRLPESRRAQAIMAQDYNISAFCYWTYWFGEGKQLLEMPIWEVYRDKNISLPFCLAWANHSWEKKTWEKRESNEIIVEQKYLGEEDYTNFFYKLLPLFRDNRYLRIDGKLFFAIWNPLDNSEIKLFISVWRELAKKENLEGFWFVGQDNDCRNKDKIFDYGFDAIYDDNVCNIHHRLPLFKKILHLVERKLFSRPTVFNYSDAIEFMVTENSKNENIIPVIAPNWDHSPRSGSNGFILHDCNPKYFKRVVIKALDIISSKPKEKQIILVRAWNEWGEGNHLEPDLKYGRGYLEALKAAIVEKSNHGNA